jgi:branched-chain amino acid transport system permease protein
VRFLNQYSKDILISIISLIILISIALLIKNPWPRDFLISIFSFGLLAMSLNMLIGFSGMVSFGHAAFFALGAYAFGLLLQNESFISFFGQFSIIIAFFMSIIITGIYSALIGAICVRLNEIYFAFLTLAFQMFLYSIIVSWVSLTGGDQGLMGGIPRPLFFGIDLSDSIHRYIFCAIVFVLCILLLRIINKSNFGYTLRLIRDNSERAEFLGIRVYRVKLICFIIASMVASVGGIIMALFTSGAYPEWAFWTQSGEAIFMIMLGGVSIFFGPLVGTILLRLINDIVQMYSDHTELVTGIIIMVVVLGLRKGLVEYFLDKISFIKK